MAGRKKHLPGDAKVVSLSLGGAERFALGYIEVQRRRRGESGETSSQIVSDAIWHLLASVEGKSRAEMETFLGPMKEEASKVKPFLTKRK